MKFTQSKTILGAAALAGVFALGTTAAHAAFLTSIGAPAKCLSTKIKAVGKGAAAHGGCFAKNTVLGLPGGEAACESKAVTKITSVFTKQDTALCTPAGQGPAAETATFNFISYASALIGTDAPSKCNKAKIAKAGKYIAGIAGCYGKAGAALPGTVIPADCLDKKLSGFLTAIGKLELPGKDCSNFGQGPALANAAHLYLNAAICTLSATSTPCPLPPGTCGNGLNDVGEACDASAPDVGWATCGDRMLCVGCNCACPSHVEFTGTASDPASVLDTGWTGISHRSPIVSDGTASVAVSCTAGSRPCGTCTISGPVANSGDGQIENQRCTNDTSIRCQNDDPCEDGGGTCQFFFGSNLPLAAGGVTVCAVNQFNGAVTGTANIETGDAGTTAFLTSKVYTGIAIDTPCARCIGDATVNDGTLGGTCSGGTRSGLACDGNGSVPGRPDYGTTSLDCPLSSGVIIATLPIDLSNATSAVTKTLSASSPDCSGDPTQKCLCDTCNNAAATPCDSNADCTAVGATVCGGLRCIGGTNAGAPCTLPGDCNSAVCNRPGAATLPSACLDDTATVGLLDCVAETCTQGPVDENCSLASGHAQRGCTGATEVADCGAPATCIAANRRCFLTGGFSALTGTNTLVAAGMADVPVADSSSPTLGAVFCVGPTSASAVNTVSGLPGPARTTIKGAAKGLP